MQHVFIKILEWFYIKQFVIVYIHILTLGKLSEPFALLLYISMTFNHCIHFDEFLNKKNKKNNDDISHFNSVNYCIHFNSVMNF